MVPGMDLAPKDCIGDSGVVADTFDAIAVDLNVGRHRRGLGSGYRRGNELRYKFRWFRPWEESHLGFVLKIHVLRDQHHHPRWLSALNLKQAPDDPVILVVRIEP